VFRLIIKILKLPTLRGNDVLVNGEPIRNSA